MPYFTDRFQATVANGVLTIRVPLWDTACKAQPAAEKGQCPVDGCTRSFKPGSGLPAHVGRVHAEALTLVILGEGTVHVSQQAAGTAFVRALALAAPEEVRSLIHDTVVSRGENLLSRMC